MSKREFQTVSLPGGQVMYRAKDGGMIFYPGMPQKMHGTKEAGRPDFDLSSYEDWPPWCQNMDTEHASIEVTKDGHVIWWGGTIHDGIACGDDKFLWMGGCFRDGIVLGGHFWNCNWINGEWRDGYFHSGTWHHGVFRGGVFEGTWVEESDSVWLGGKFFGTVKRSHDPAREYWLNPPSADAHIF